MPIGLTLHPLRPILPAKDRHRATVALTVTLRQTRFQLKLRRITPGRNRQFQISTAIAIQGLPRVKRHGANILPGMTDVSFPTTKCDRDRAISLVFQLY